MREYQRTTKEIKITDTQTGESRIYLDTSWIVDDDDLNDYIWSEGNYSCDCNRYLFFARANGEERIDEEISCTPLDQEPRYQVEIDGKVY